MKRLTHQEILDEIAALKVVPVIKIDDPAQALPLGRALVEGGLPVAEITLRSPHGLAAIRAVRENFPQILLGAGTILTPDDAGRALEAGADFLVSPGFNPKVVEFSLKNQALIIPGVNSPTTVEAGLEFGLSTLKFFPAEQSGGLAMLKALQGPYGQVRFMPTGGVGPHNLADYLAAENVVAVGGSWMVAPKLLNSGDFAAVRNLCAEATAMLA